jgi:hypothetical protein
MIFETKSFSPTSSGHIEGLITSVFGTLLFGQASRRAYDWKPPKKTQRAMSNALQYAKSPIPVMQEYQK